jgi:hypothetical protein
MPRNEVRKSKKMPSIKKRVTGFIRQISGPSQVAKINLKDPNLS